MSIGYLEKTAAPVSTTTPPSESVTEVRRPVFWLSLILIVGLVLRMWYLLSGHYPYQQDELGTVYAVAERAVAPGDLPTAADPLVPVMSWAEVKARSILPYGIVNPVPLYHYILYATLHVLPVTDWALRLPSVLAGVGCILGIYLLCRRLLTAEVALVAAAMVAVDPMQKFVSFIARPYALANLATVFSFLTLVHLLDSRKQWLTALYAIAYGVCVAFIGYMNSALLLVGVAHVALVAFAAVNSEGGVARKVAWWLAGCGVALALLLPEIGYLLDIRAFYAANQEYMARLESARLLNVLLHNSTFLVTLLVIPVAGFVIHEMLAGESQEGESESQSNPEPTNKSIAPSEPVEELPAPPESQQLLWLGRAWFFLPQLAALILALLAAQFVFVSRYVSYTSLGGVILLAYWATRARSPEVRRGVSLAAILTVFFWGFMTVSEGRGLFTPPTARMTVRDLDMLEEQGRWQEGDVLLIRSGFLEGDFLPNKIPAENRQRVLGALAAPITTIYAPKSPKTFIVLSMSRSHGEDLKTITGDLYDPSFCYTPELVEKLNGYQRFWIFSLEYDRPGFMAGFLPWLASELDWDLKVARKRPDPDRYFDVPTDIGADDFVAGLSDGRPTDFTHLVLIRRKQPKGIFTLGALSAALMPHAHTTVPVWIAGMERTPRLTNRLDEEATLDEPLEDEIKDAKR